MYGIGIRLGIYLQWLSSILASCAFEELARPLAKVYLITNIGITAAIFRMSTQITCNFAMKS